ncbi:MAG: four helix bundle protein [Phycisphaerales bacterium]|nr:four helix bundle protein [Phycisphaerales bacterium]
MGRLRTETLERVELFADRVLDLAEALDGQRRFRRIVEQVAASGTSVGAILFEADQSITAKDFARTLGIVTKELNETRYWIRLIGRREWISPARLDDLLRENEELLAMFNAMIVRTRKSASRHRPTTTASP